MNCNAGTLIVVLVLELLCLYMNCCAFTLDAVLVNAAAVTKI